MMAPLSSMTRYTLYVLCALVFALVAGIMLWFAFFLILRKAFGVPDEPLLFYMVASAFVILFYFVPAVMTDVLAAVPYPRPARFTWSERRRRRKLVRDLKAARRQRRADHALDRLSLRVDEARARVAFRLPGLERPLYAATPADMAAILASAGLQRRYEQGLDRCHPSARTPIPLDTTTLSDAARALFLGALIGAGDGRRYDRLIGRDALTGHLTYRSAARAIDMAHWRRALPTIASLLGQLYALHERDGVSLTLVPLADLPAVVTVTAADVVPGALLLGVDLVTGLPHRLALTEFTHTLVAGPSGMGKSTFANLLIWQLARQAELCAELILVDLKDGLEFSRFAGVAGNIRVVDSLPQLATTLTALEATMADRLAALKVAGRVTWQGPPVIVIVDEFAHIALHPSAERKAVLDAFVRIGNQARAAGIHLILQVQHAVSDTLPTALRRNLVATLSFRQPSGQAAAALFGDTQDFPADITKLRPGQFIYRTGRTAETFALQAPVPPALTLRGEP